MVPTVAVDVASTFGFESDQQVAGFDEASLGDLAEHVPAVDDAYRFDAETTLAILSGFDRNRRVLVQGRHGTGKSTHIEQVAARLNWPCVRVNLDGHITRLDLVGRDVITLREGRQVTEFAEGMLPWSLQRPVALVFDEFDAGRPDVMFVIQRVLETDGRFTLVDQNRVITPHSGFRLFATANTVGLGNLNGMYHGAQQLNHSQLDRWNVTATLNYLPSAAEQEIVAARVPELAARATGKSTIESMVAVAGLTRDGFTAGDISTVMSPRTVISWAENMEIFRDIGRAFSLAFLNRCDEAEQSIVAEYFQRVFNIELESSIGGSTTSSQG